MNYLTAAPCHDIGATRASLDRAAECSPGALDELTLSLANTLQGALVDLERMNRWAYDAALKECLYHRTLADMELLNTRTFADRFAEKLRANLGQCKSTWTQADKRREELADVYDHVTERELRLVVLQWKSRFSYLVYRSTVCASIRGRFLMLLRELLSRESPPDVALSFLP